MIVSLLEWLAYPIIGTAKSLPMYAPGDGFKTLIASIFAHGSALHVWKNVVSIVLGVTLVRRVIGWKEITTVLIVCAPLGNWMHAVVFQTPTYGASMGTFALLGVGSIVAIRQWPFVTIISISMLAIHQIFLGNPSVVIGHAVFGVIGIVIGIVSIRRRDYNWPPIQSMQLQS